MTIPSSFDPADQARATRARRNDRAQFWRVALGLLGLFWVGVLLALMA